MFVDEGRVAGEQHQACCLAGTEEFQVFEAAFGVVLGMADQHAEAAQIGGGPEPVLIRDIIADTKRRMTVQSPFQQPGDGSPLVPIHVISSISISKSRLVKYNVPLVNSIFTSQNHDTWLPVTASKNDSVNDARTDI